MSDENEIPEENEEEEDDSNEEEDDDGEDQPEVGTPAGCKLFVGGVTSSTTEATLLASFKEYGKVNEILVKRENDPGYAFITLDTEENAKKAIDALNSTQIGDSSVMVSVARTKGGARGRGGRGGRSWGRGGASYGSFKDRSEMGGGGRRGRGRGGRSGDRGGGRSRGRRGGGRGGSRGRGGGRRGR